MVKFCSLVYLMGKSEPILPWYLHHTVIFTLGPLSRSDIWIQRKTAADIMHNHPHHLGNTFFPAESCYILLQSSYSPKNCIKNGCLLDKGRPCRLLFTSLLTQINFYASIWGTFYMTLQVIVEDKTTTQNLNYDLVDLLKAATLIPST